MYIGSTSKKMLHHLVWGIVDNSIERSPSWICQSHQECIEPDNSITMWMMGVEFLLIFRKRWGRPAVETVFTVLHAGGKFGGGGYKVSGGLHGVGSSSSKRSFNATRCSINHKNGKIHYQEPSWSCCC